MREDDSVSPDYDKPSSNPWSQCAVLVDVVMSSVCLCKNSQSLLVKVTYPCVTSRQCATAALNDVRQYLTDEGGQVAVGQVT